MSAKFAIDARRQAFALKTMEAAHQDGLGGADLVASQLAVAGIMFSDSAAGDPDRYEALVQETVDVLWANPKAPPRPTDAGQLLSADELVAHEALVRAAIRWTKGPKAKVMPAFDLIMAELRRLRTKV